MRLLISIIFLWYLAIAPPINEWKLNIVTTESPLFIGIIDSQLQYTMDLTPYYFLIIWMGVAYAPLRKPITLTEHMAPAAQISRICKLLESTIH